MFSHCKSLRIIVAIFLLVSQILLFAQQPPTNPHIGIVAINTPTTNPIYDAGTASTIDLAGTATIGVTFCSWTNSLGGSGVTTGVTNWTITGISLTVGSNVITVTCTNNAGTTGNDIITITASSSGVTNPISSSRHATAAWALAGVNGGIPTRTTICQTLGTAGQSSSFAQSVTAAQINTAIDNCADNGVVFLNTGTYTLSSSIDLDNDHTVLRGAGADNTKLIFTGSSNNCHYFDDGAVTMCSNTDHYGADPNGLGGAGVYDHVVNWVGGYTEGTSTIQLSDKTGLAVGEEITLDQLDDASDGYPATGDIFVCQTDGTNNCSNQSGGGNGARTGRAQMLMATVTSIEAGSCAPSCDIGITPAIYGANWRSGRTPQAYYSNAGTFLRDVGLENLSIDFTSLGSNSMGIFMKTCMDCWVRGNRIIRTDTAGVSELFSYAIIDSFRSTFQSNYSYGSRHDYHATPQNQNYAMTILASDSMLIENNIFHRNPSGIVVNGPVLGSVFAYNYVVAASYTSGGTVLHGTSLYNLHEGNDMSGVLGDIIHGPHYFETSFRNLFSLDANNPGVNVAAAGPLRAKSRFWNYVGNVMGASSATVYEDNSNNPATDGTGCGSCIYDLGYEGDDNTFGNPRVSNDVIRVKATFFRWGNWDTETNNTRWCASGHTNFTNAAVCNSISEVPSGITNFSNSVPTTETLPNSLYLTSKPCYFGSISWPQQGPDITGGNVSGYGGHANKVPARVAFEAMTDDSAYTAGTVRVFNSNTRYGC